MNVERNVPVYRAQLRALLRKNATVQLRQRKTNCCQCCFPILCVLVPGLMQVLLGSMAVPSDNVSPPMYRPIRYGTPSNGCYGSNSVVEMRPTALPLGHVTRNGTGAGLFGNVSQQSYTNGWRNAYPADTPARFLVPDYTPLEGVAPEDADMHLFEKFQDMSDLVADSPDNVYYVFFNLPTAVIKVDTYDSEAFAFTVQTFEKFGEYTYSAIQGNMPSLCNSGGDGNHRLKLMEEVVSLFGRAHVDEDLQIVSGSMTMPKRDADFWGLRLILGLMSLIFLPFAMMFLMPVLISTVVEEREKGLVEHMKIMGLSTKYYFFMSYFYDFLLYLAFNVVFVSVGGLLGIQFFKEAPPELYVFLFLAWGLALPALAYFFAVFFEKPRTASLFGYLIIAASLLTGAFVNLLGYKTDRPSGWYFLYPPFVFVRGCYLMMMVMFGESLVAQYRGQVVECIMILLVHAVAFNVLAWYLDLVFPRSRGKRESVLFPLHWLMKRLNAQEKNVGMDHQALIPADGEQASRLIDVEADVMAETNAIKRGERDSNPIVINDLSKVYPASVGNPPKRALDSLFIAIREGELLGLLGPNGAGKTTLISILVGLFPPTSGDVRVGDWSLKNNIEEIRAEVGLCPQFDILWDNLTVQEHLLFFTRLKRWPASAEKAIVERVIAEVGLEEAVSRMAGDLSGGMKRRLSLGIALVGNPRLVFLDEPSTGLDPATRRGMWDVIRDVRKRRNMSIVMSTHSMEEAGVLSDRIAIMSRGSLKCLGTPPALKERYGRGFQLQINTSTENVERARGFVEREFPSAIMESSLLGSTKFIIPKHDLQLSTLFRVMERNKAVFGIKDWSINESSLEDVFLKLVAEDEAAEDEFDLSAE